MLLNESRVSEIIFVLSAQTYQDYRDDFALETFQKKIFLLCQNKFKNEYKSSLGAKEVRENNFQWYIVDFGPKTHFEKKSC